MDSLADPHPTTRLHRRKFIEEAIAEIDEILRTAAPSPAVRELRVRHGSLARVVHGWGDTGPHAAQLTAMQECMVELRVAVLKACPPRPRETAAAPAAPAAPAPQARPTARALPVRHMKTTRPPPRRASKNRSTRPPPGTTGANGGGGPPSSRRG